jgi:hypothetical protein
MLKYGHQFVEWVCKLMPSRFEVGVGVGATVFSEESVQLFHAHYIKTVLPHSRTDHRDTVMKDVVYGIQNVRVVDQRLRTARGKLAIVANKLTQDEIVSGNVRVTQIILVICIRLVLCLWPSYPCLLYLLGVIFVTQVIMREDAKEKKTRHTDTDRLKGRGDNTFESSLTKMQHSRLHFVVNVHFSPEFG